MRRSLLAVFGGWIVIQILVALTDEILIRVFLGQGARPLPAPDWLVGARLAFGAAYTVFGGWLTVLIAPERPWRHALYLIVLGETMGLFYAVSSLGELPFWYIAALLVLYPPAVLAGAWWRLRGGGAGQRGGAAA